MFTIPTPTWAELGTAAGIVAMILFAILGFVAGSPAAVVGGCGGGLVLLAASVARAYFDNRSG